MYGIICESDSPLLTARNERCAHGTGHLLVAHSAAHVGIERLGKHRHSAQQGSHPCITHFCGREGLYHCLYFGHYTCRAVRHPATYENNQEIDPAAEMEETRGQRPYPSLSALLLCPYPPRQKKRK